MRVPRWARNIPRLALRPSRACLLWLIFVLLLQVFAFMASVHGSYAPPVRLLDGTAHAINALLFDKILLDLLEHNPHFHSLTFGLTGHDAPAHANLIFMNYEHVIVRQGGRSTESAPLSPQKYRGQQYVVRLVDADAVKKADIVIEYCYANVVHIQLSGMYDAAFMQKFVYIPTLPFEYDNHAAERTLELLTTILFLDPFASERRVTMMGQLQQATNNSIQNINNIDPKNFEALKALYDKTRILINIHQTPHHHTLEELRLLPALQRGVIIISEEVPLQWVLPFQQYIVWCAYDDIPLVVRHVRAHYDQYFDLIHGPNSGISKVLQGMKDTAHATLKARLETLVERAKR